VSFEHLWQPLRIGSVEVRNRVFVSGHTTNFGSNNLPTERHVAYHRERARGGVGLIFTEAIRVHPTTVGRSSTIAGYLPESVPGFRRIVDAVHEEGARIFAQLEHSGRSAVGLFARTAPWAPSAIPWATGAAIPHVMTHVDIAELIRAFRQGARHALEAGFDGLEVHLGHGHLLNQFLSPISNARNDEYGGSEASRLRLSLEVMRAVRDEVGTDVSLGIRISADEFLPGGLDLEDMARITRVIVDTVPLQFVNVSHSHYHASLSLATQIADMSFPSAPFLHLPRRIKQAVPELPVFAIGRIDTLEIAERVIAEGIADMVGMTRAHIADPHIVRKARDNRAAEIRPCVACNQGCIGMVELNLPITCLLNPEVGREAEWGSETWTRAAKPARVLVVGGGPAGMAAARAAALCGHAVELWEQSADLGGQLRIAARLRNRERLGLAITYLAAELARIDVTVRRGTTATSDLVRTFDHVIVATGSHPEPSPIAGVHDVITIVEAATRPERLGAHVAIKDLDGGWPAAALAEHLAALGKHVSIVTPLSGLSPAVTIYSRLALTRRLGDLHVDVRPLRRVVRGEGNVLILADVITGTEEPLHGVTDVVSAGELVADSKLADSLNAEGASVEIVGDAYAPRTTLDAIFEGYRAGRRVIPSAR
jgi:2,4-dienoyl-CoA reductase-like NADH-dependent reductase (Old Yellow Enzyme family)/thioredoxin reductase